MPLDRNTDPAAMAARIKELEAAQAAVPPVSPLVRLWTIGGEVLGLFPKWLLVAALAVFIAYHGYSYYMQSSRMQAENDLATAQAAETKARADAMSAVAPRANYDAPSPATGKLREIEAHGAADGGSCDANLRPLPKGTKADAPIQRGDSLPQPPCVSLH